MTIVIRCCNGNLLLSVGHIIFWDEERKILELFSRYLLDQAQIWHRGLILGPEFELLKILMYDVILTSQ